MKRGPKPGPRFPIEDLERLVAAKMGPRSLRRGGGFRLAGGERYYDPRDRSRDGWTDADMADRLGITIAALRQHRVRGLSQRNADVLAVAAGYHPAEVWPEWLEEVAS